LLGYRGSKERCRLRRRLRLCDVDLDRWLHGCDRSERVGLSRLSLDRRLDERRGGLWLRNRLLEDRSGALSHCRHGLDGEGGGLEGGLLH
jgi:hypothetical protein